MTIQALSPQDCKDTIHFDYEDTVHEWNKWLRAGKRIFQAQACHELPFPWDRRTPEQQERQYRMEHRAVAEFRKAGWTVDELEGQYDDTVWRFQ